MLFRSKGFFLLPNLFTTASLFAGFYAIVQPMNGYYDHAAIAIMVALIMDGLDGRVARLTNTQSPFGSEYDSLSDMVSFGVAPALVIYVWALQPLGRLGWVAAFIYCACAAIRLARFNVNSSAEPSWRDNFFEGIPSPAGGVLVLIPLIYSLSEIQIFEPNYQIVVPTLFIIVSILLISKIPTYSLKRIAVPRKTTIFLLFSIILFFGLLFVYTFNTIVIAGLIYLFMIPVSAFHYYSISKNKKIEEDEIDYHEDVL